MLYRKRNFDLPVSHFALKRNLVMRKCWPGNRDYMENVHPGIVMPRSQLAGLKFFHVIAKLIFSVFHRRAEIPANRASPAKRASPPHVIGPLGAHCRSRAGLVEGLALSAEMTVQPGIT